MQESQRYAMAKERVRKIKGFWIHLAVYLVVNASLFALNIVKDPEELWFYWVLAGWGAGVLLHASRVFGDGIARDWEERKIEEMVRRDEKEERSRTKTAAK